MRLAAPLTIVLLTALLAGCGGSGEGSDETGATGAPRAGQSAAPAGATPHDCKPGSAGAESLRATGLGCERARGLVRAWRGDDACAPAAGASRSACALESFRCLTAVTGRGLSVSCAKPERSVAFLVKSG